MTGAGTEPMSAAMERAYEIYSRYTDAYGWNTQGCCLLVADEILRAVGGEPVAGELTWYGGSCRRTHWWVEKDGEVLDPMGDAFIKYEDYAARVEHHRDAALFARLLPTYEKWRIHGATT